MQIKVTSSQYIFPPRPKTAMPFDQVVFFTEIGWGWQYKVNDSRCLIKYLPDGTVELWNRHAERFRSYTCPDWLEDQLLKVRDILGLDAYQLHILDGGLLDQKHAAIKDTIVIWDILVRNNLHLLGTTYKERFDSIAIGTAPYKFSHPTYNSPITFGRIYGDPEETSNIFHLEWNPDGDPHTCWKQVHQINTPFGPNSPLIEGMVFKDPNGRLEMGLQEKNNDTWMCRTRVKTGRHAF